MCGAVKMRLNWRENVTKCAIYGGRLTLAAARAIIKAARKNGKNRAIYGGDNCQ